VEFVYIQILGEGHLVLKLEPSSAVLHAGFRYLLQQGNQTQLQLK